MRRDNDWKKVTFGYALTLKLRSIANGGPSVRWTAVEYDAASGPMWVSRMGKEDSALSVVTVRNMGA